MNGAQVRHLQELPATPPAAVIAAEDAESMLLWSGIRQAAELAAQREPLLRARMQAMVLRHGGLPAALSAVLSRRMACAELPEQALWELMQEVLAQNPVAVARFCADLLAVKERDPACPDHLHVLLNLKGFQALQAYRIAHALWNAERRELAFALSNQASIAFAVDIHPAARIGAGVMIDHGTGVVIGETTVVEDNVSILQNVTLGGTGKEHGDRHPKVRTGVMIGAGATILGNIEVGAMSKVAAGSVVLRPVPPHSTVAGVPARVVKHAAADTCPSQEMDQML